MCRQDIDHIQFPTNLFLPTLSLIIDPICSAAFKSSELSDQIFLPQNLMSPHVAIVGRKPPVNRGSSA
jgi:hypothetical protein